MRTHKKSWLKTATSVQLAAATLVLTACGGGGSDSTPVAPPAVPASLTVGGTAATGAALASAAVQIKCVGGTGTATTGADGLYSVAIVGASLPCVLSATSGTTTLRSVAEAGSATTATVNITPLSEIIVARLAGGDAGTLFTTFDAAAQAKLTATALADARTAVTTALKSAIDLTGIDPIKDALVAASAGKTGNALDQKLDSLGAALKAGQTTLADVVAAVVANPDTPAVVQALLQPAAATCAGLRSGNYRALDLSATTTELASARVKIDASALSFTGADGRARTLKDEGGCHFSADSSATHFYLAKSGLGLWIQPDAKAVRRPVLLVPEQTLPLSEVAGTWNLIGYGKNDEDVTVGSTTTNGTGFSVETIDATSAVTAGSDCAGLSACVSWTPRASDAWKANTDGGFDQVDPEYPLIKLRAFLFKGANGQTVFFAVRIGGHGTQLVVAAKQQPLSLPAVGQIDKFWDATIAANTLAVPDTAQTTIKAVDSTAQSYTRERASDGRVDSIAINKPRSGLRYRAAGSSAGKTFGDTLFLPLPGLGLTFTAPTSGGDSLGVSVIQ